VVSASAPADLGECQWVEKTELLRIPISTVLKKAYRLVERAIALPGKPYRRGHPRTPEAAHRG